jgi:hypothetical protein
MSKGSYYGVSWARDMVLEIIQKRFRLLGILTYIGSIVSSSIYSD